MNSAMCRRVRILRFECSDDCKGQKYRRRLDENQTANMIRTTATRPAERASRILAGRAPLQHDNNPYLEDFGVRISTEMMQCQGRVLNPPMLKYHPSSKESTVRPRDGGWNMRDKKMCKGASMDRWSVICFGSTRDFPQNVVEQFLRMLIETCNDSGVTVARQMPSASYCSPQGNIESALVNSANNLSSLYQKIY